MYYYLQFLLLKLRVCQFNHSQPYLYNSIDDIEKDTDNIEDNDTHKIYVTHSDKMSLNAIFLKSLYKAIFLKSVYKGIFYVDIIHIDLFLKFRQTYSNLYILI